MRLFLLYAVLFFSFPLTQLEAGSPLSRKGNKVLVFTACNAGKEEACEETISFLRNSCRDFSVVSFYSSPLEASHNDRTYLNYPRDILSELWSRDEINGYSREGLIHQLKDVCMAYKPDFIYLPFQQLTQNNDQFYAAAFIYKSLSECKLENKPGALKVPEILYYAIENEGRVSFRDNYFIDGEKKKGFVKPPGNPKAYLQWIYANYKKSAQEMKRRGYNVNFGIVADVAVNKEDLNIDLCNKQRIFSDKPKTAIDLVYIIARAHNDAGIIPVIKHFPGLGSAVLNSHKRLPVVNLNKERIYAGELLVYKELIKKGMHFWVMTSHAVYPGLDEKKPASLSHNIQTEILRKEMGFKGIIISDEFLCMHSIEEYAMVNGIKKPYIGRIAAESFAVGTDIVLLHPFCEKIEFLFSDIMNSVNQALKKGQLTLEDIDESVIRILKEKERIYGRKLVYLARDMTLEQKIAQKIMISLEDKQEIPGGFMFTGVQPRGKDFSMSVGRKDYFIPFFFACQHEGGAVSENRLNLYSPSANLLGAEYDRILSGASNNADGYGKTKNKYFYYQDDIPLMGFRQLPLEGQKMVVQMACNFLQECIDYYSKSPSESPLLCISKEYSFMSLFAFDKDRVYLNNWKELVVSWMAKCPDKSTAFFIYQAIGEAFKKLSRGNYFLNLKENYSNELIRGFLAQLKNETENIGFRQIKKPLKVLCLAAHPDDEDGTALLYFKDKFQAQTYILFATRGEGGNNLFAGQPQENLAYIRTKESEEAAKILGVDGMYFLGNIDFGYTSDSKKTLDIWGRPETLKKLVYFFRLIQPDIIITRHSGSNREHGQHKAFLELAKDAFDLSSNEEYSPEMLNNQIMLWQPRRFYQFDITKFPDLTVDSRQEMIFYNKTYAQLALDALKKHKSQSIAARTKLEDYNRFSYRLTKSFPAGE